jgi:iduronate 2-sulfatase
MGYSLNTPEYHYIEWYRWDNKKGLKGDFVASELYHRIKDPHETKNLVGLTDYKNVVSNLSEQLEKGWREAIPNR